MEGEEANKDNEICLKDCFGKGLEKGELGIVSQSSSSQINLRTAEISSNNVLFFGGSNAKYIQVFDIPTNTNIGKQMFLDIGLI